MFNDVGLWGHPAVTVVAVLAAIGLVGFLVELRGRATMEDRAAVPPEPGLAWLRAGAYFCACVLVAWCTGALATVHLRDAFTNTSGWSSGGWWAFTLVCVAVEFVAYWIIWPRGTYTLDRPRDLRWQVPFGLAWGVCQGLLFLSIWFAISALDVSGRTAGVLAFVAIATYQGLWHGLYWDRYVAPEHNDPAWNLPKVLCCHVPNLAVTLAYLTVIGNPVMFVSFQTIALLGSTIFMRFPRYPARPWAVAVAHR
jgi:hypothetical protein